MKKKIQEKKTLASFLSIEAHRHHPKLVFECLYTNPESNSEPEPNVPDDMSKDETDETNGRGSFILINQLLQFRQGSGYNGLGGGIQGFLGGDDRTPNVPDFDTPGSPNVNPTEGIDALTEENQGNSPCSDGNPIDISTQNKYQEEVDYIGSGRLPLSMVRSYNSVTSRVTSLGVKWRSNHDMRLIVDLLITDSFTGQNKPSIITITEADGHSMKLKLGGDGKWRNASGKVFDLRYLPEEGVWCFTEGGVIWKFSVETGLLLSITEPYGEELIYSYNDELQLTRVDKNTGESLTFSYKSSGLLDEVVTPNGMTISYSHIQSGPNFGQLIFVDYEGAGLTGQHRRQYSYMGNYRLTRITDENGDRYANWEYEVNRDAARLSYHGNHQERFEILSSTESEVDGVKYKDVVTKNANDKQTTYKFQRFGEKWQIIDVQGHQAGTCLAANQTTTYDSLGYVNTTTDWQGNVMDYDYDDEGRVLKVVSGKGGANEQTTTMTWDTNLNLPDVTTTDTTITDNDYDARGRLIQTRVTDRITGEVRTSSISYTDFANGLMKTMTVDGPRADVNDVVTTEYNAAGHMIKITNALGHITQFSDYNGRGQAQTITHADGRVDKLTYHIRGWLLKRENDFYGQKRTSTFIYDKVGQIKSQNIQGVQTSFEYDDAHRLTKELYFTDSWDFGGSYYNQTESDRFTPSIFITMLLMFSNCNN